MHEFNENPDVSASNETHIYTWLNATLRELYNACKTAIPAANRKDSRVVFFHIYQDTSGRFKKKSIAHLHSVKRSKMEEWTLSSLRFEIGDMLEINIEPSVPKVPGRS